MDKKNKSKRRAGCLCAIIGVVLLLAIFLGLLINALLVMFKDDYYTTFGNYRLFAITTDSMEPEIPTGSMIVCKKPSSPDEIKADSSKGAHDGTVITFKYEKDGKTILFTHRVVAISTDNDGETVYTTRGDNAGGDDGGTRKFSDVVGIYTGKKCGFFGSLFGFFQSSQGASLLIFTIFIIIIAWIVIVYVNRTEAKKKLISDALAKCNDILSSVKTDEDGNYALAEVHEVINLIAAVPKTRTENKRITERLIEFVGEEYIAPWQWDEAVEPENAEPEITEITETAETPEATDATETVQEEIAEQENADTSESVTTATETAAASEQPQAAAVPFKSRRAYDRYREMSAQLELRQAEQLQDLLNETEQLTSEEQLKVAEYRAEQQSKKKQSKPRAPRTPEQKAAAKAAALRRKEQHQAFLNALNPADRELYETEQKLAKSRQATIRMLKRLAADRKLLDEIDGTDETESDNNKPDNE